MIVLVASAAIEFLVVCKGHICAWAYRSGFYLVINVCVRFFLANAFLALCNPMIWCDNLVWIYSSAYKGWLGGYQSSQYCQSIAAALFRAKRHCVPRLLDSELHIVSSAFIIGKSDLDHEVISSRYHYIIGVDLPRGRIICFVLSGKQSQAIANNASHGRCSGQLPGQEIHVSL